MPTRHKTEETVDRSRLQLLGALAAAGASGACVETSERTADQQYKEYEAYQKAKKLSPDTEKPPRIGGEGESGGSHGD